MVFEIHGLQMLPVY